MSQSSKPSKSSRKRQVKIGSTLDTLQREEGRMTFMEYIRSHGKVALLAFTIIMAIAIFGGLGIGQFNTVYNVYDYSYDATGKRVKIKRPTRNFIKSLLVAKCEGENITRVDFNRSYYQVRENAESQDSGTIEPIKDLQLRDLILRDTVEQIVLRKFARDKNLKPDEEKVKELVATTKKQFVIKKSKDDKPKSIVGAIKSKLEPQESYDQWYSYLQSRGIDERQFVNEVRKAQLAQQAKEFMKKEIEDKQFKELMPKAEQYYKEIKEGKISFDEAVVKYSDAAKSEKDAKGVLQDPIWKTMRSHEWVDKVFAKDVKPGQILPPMISGDPSEKGIEIIKYLGPAVPTEGELKDEAFRLQWLERYKTWWKDDPVKSKVEKLSDEELKDIATKAKVQRILLLVKDNGELDNKLNDMIEKANLEIYDNFILCYRAYDGAAERTAEARKAGKDHLTEKEATETRFVMRPGEQFSIFVYKSGKRRFADAIKYARIAQKETSNQIDDFLGYYLEAFLYREWLNAQDALEKPGESKEKIMQHRIKAIEEALKLSQTPNVWIFFEQAMTYFDKGDKKAMEDAMQQVLKYGLHQPVLMAKVKQFYKDKVKDEKRLAEIEELAKKPKTTEPGKPVTTFEIPEKVADTFEKDNGQAAETTTNETKDKQEPKNNAKPDNQANSESTPPTKTEEKAAESSNSDKTKDSTDSNAKTKK